MIDETKVRAESVLLKGLDDLEVGDYPAAIGSFWQAIAEVPEYREAWEHLACALQRSSDDQGLDQAVLKAAELEIRSKEIWYALANALDGTKAQAAFWRALQIDPDYEQALTGLAWSLRTSGKKEEAIYVYEHLLDLFTRRQDPLSLNSLGDTLRRLVGALDLAEEAVGRALKLDPEYFDAWKNLSYVMCSRREPARAQQILRRFIQTYPAHRRRADAWVCLGTVLRSTGDLKGAEEAVRRAVEIDAECQLAWSKLSDILFELGHEQEAQVALRRADDLDYNQKYDETPGQT